MKGNLYNRVMGEIISFEAVFVGAFMALSLLFILARNFFGLFSTVDGSVVLFSMFPVAAAVALILRLCGIHFLAVTVNPRPRKNGSYKKEGSAKLNAEELYRLVTESALQHGRDSEPDHEVGDLQQALEIALDLMNEEQLVQFQSGWEAL